MISTVSIVGVDQNVCPEYLSVISQEYPFVEWALDIRDDILESEWLVALLENSEKLRLRGILHDNWNHDIINGFLSLKEERPGLWRALQRIQIDNTNDEGHLIDSIQLIPDKNIILTKPDPTLDMFNTCVLLSKDNNNVCNLCGRSVDDTDIDQYVRSGFDCWLSVEFPRPIDLFKVEELLDKVEDSIAPASWLGGLLQTQAIQKRFSDYPKNLSDEMESPKI